MVPLGTSHLLLTRKLVFIFFPAKLASKILHFILYKIKKITKLHKKMLLYKRKVCEKTRENILEVDDLDLL